MAVESEECWKKYYFYDGTEACLLDFAVCGNAMSYLSVISYEYYVLQNLIPLLVSLFSVQAEFCCGSL